MLDVLQHARLSAEVRKQCPKMAAEIDTWLYQKGASADGVEPAGIQILSISNNRLSGLVNSLAWHERRREPGVRVQALEQELQRLRKKVEEQSQEWKLYDFLLQKLGSDQTPNNWIIRVFKELRLSEKQRERWRDQTRLMLAQAALQIIQTLLNGAQVRQKLETEYKGALRWR